MQDVLNGTNRQVENQQAGESTYRQVARTYRQVERTYRQLRELTDRLRKPIKHIHPQTGNL